MAVADLVIAYGREYDRLRAATAAQVLAAWLALGGPDDERANEFVAAAVALVLAGQRAIAETIDAYLAEYIGETTGIPGTLVGIPAAEVTGAAVRNGVPPETVYQRGVIELRRLLGDGKPYGDAFRQAGERMQSTAGTDVILAHRQAARIGMDAQGVVGYRRVLTGRSCLLCATASTQRYRSENLLPIHSHCDCRVAPIVGKRDPGQVINRDVLRSLKADTGRNDYWNARGIVDESGRVIPGAKAYDVHQHGELGPVLTDSSHDFTGPSDLAE